MRIEHIAVYVNNLEYAKVFFEKYFNAVAGSKYQNVKTGFSSYFMSFDSGSRLELMYKKDMCNNENQQQKKFHIAFATKSVEKVNELTSKLKNDGYKVVSGPRTTGDGYYESCIEIFDNIIIEVTV